MCIRDRARCVSRSRLERLAVDTHGYTDFGMAVAKLLNLDLCPDVLERFGSAARGDRIYQAGHALGQLLRTVLPVRLLCAARLSQAPVPVSYTHLTSA